MSERILIARRAGSDHDARQAGYLSGTEEIQPMPSPTDQSAKFEKFFQELDPQLRPAAVALGDLVRDAAPGAQETVKWGFPTWVARGNVCSISPGTGYVRLQLFRGTELSDATHILEGTGKSMRHVKVRDSDTMPSDAIAALVREAISLNAS